MTRRVAAVGIPLVVGAAIAAGVLAFTGSDEPREGVATTLPEGFVPDYGGLSGSSTFASIEQLKEGWQTDFSRHTVPLKSFQRGGPGRDGIPAVRRAIVVPVDEVDFLPEDEPVLELVVNGRARAYPFGALLFHEIVNDRVGGVPVVVTFCPLCNTAIAFDGRVGGVTLTFGATGNLRNADLVMYDHQTESWWQQFGGEGVVGRHAGAALRRLPARGILWEEFKAEHPDGSVATSADALGLDLFYGENPYLGTLDPLQPSPFPAGNADDRRLPPSERVVLIEEGDDAVAVPFSLLEEKKEIEVALAGKALVVRLNGRTADVRDESGALVNFSEPFWFSVAAFRPGVVIVAE